VGLTCTCLLVSVQDLKRRDEVGGATETMGPLIAEPEVFESTLGEGDEFMIIGCDGLWDSFGGEEPGSDLDRAAPPVLRRTTPASAPRSVHSRPTYGLRSSKAICGTSKLDVPENQ